MEVTPQVENKLTANMNISKKDIIIGNFLGGLSWGIGSVVGIALITVVVGFALKGLGVFDQIGSLLSPINEIKNLNQGLPQIPQITK